MRFAFYGRISTSGYQDQPSSRQWQYGTADRLITGPGLIVVEFFDVVLRLHGLDVSQFAEVDTIEDGCE